MIFEKKPLKSCNLHIRLYEHERDMLKELAKNNNMTVSELVKKAVNEYAKTLEDK